MHDVLLSVSINQQKITEPAFMMADARGGLWVRREDLHLWRLRAPDSEPQLFGGEAFYPLDVLTGLTYQLNEATQSLAMTVPAGLFVGTNMLGARTPPPAPTPSPPGGFANYDVIVSREPERTITNAFVELGAFNGGGVGLTNFLRRDTIDGPEVVRLSTTWTRDLPQSMSSVRAGDVIGGGGSWGNPVRLGGLQWATDFATRPGFVTFPLPGLAGETALPSSVDLYVNDVLRLRRNVPEGPFSIQDLPVITGPGEVRLVVTDLLGRQQVITAPYYTTSSLLVPGLRAYSYEVGAIRRNFGFESNAYGRGLAQGTYRSGLSEYFTGEVRGELLESQQTAGLAGVFLWPAAGVFTVSLAGSHSEPQQREDIRENYPPSPGGSGGLAGLGFQGQNQRLGYGANIQLTTRRFTQVGLQPGEPAPRRISQAFFSAGVRKLGSISLSYTTRDSREGDDIELLNGNYNVAVGGFGYLGASVLRILKPRAEYIFGLTLTRPMGDRTTGSVNARKSDGRSLASVRMQRSLPPGEGMGYRVGAGVGDLDRVEASASLRTRVGTYVVDAVKLQGETGYRASASGGIAMLAGDMHLSRRIDNSFAIVEVPGYANVNVYQDNQPIARTNSAGKALIPRLRPYQLNTLRVEQGDLPMDAQVDSLSASAVPYRRSGLLLSFPVKRSRGAVFTILLESGEPVPAGAVGMIDGQGTEFPVGMRGEIYMSDLDINNQVVVTWAGQRCEFAITFSESSDPLPNLGTHTCSGMKP